MSIAAPQPRQCSSTGLRLVPARNEIAFRVAKDRIGSLNVHRNAWVGPPPIGSKADLPDRRGRFDTIGSTVYLADSRRCAYSEVLGGFRLNRASIGVLAESVGMSTDEYLQQVEEEAIANEVDVPWGISVDWQMDRSIYEIRLPRTGWWVQIDHPETLRALETLTDKNGSSATSLLNLTAEHLFSESRDITTLLSHAIRESTLDDGSEPLGVCFASKTLMGRCWAYWDRRADEGLPPGRNDLLQLTAENVGPDPDFRHVAEHYSLPILGRTAT